MENVVDADSALSEDGIVNLRCGVPHVGKVLSQHDHAASAYIHVGQTLHLLPQEDLPPRTLVLNGNYTYWKLMRLCQKRRTI